MSKDLFERNPYDINIYYDDLVKDANYYKINIFEKSNHIIIAHDTMINKKVTITKDSIGNVDELQKINSKLKIIDRYGYIIGNYAEFDIYDLVNSSKFSDYVYDNIISFKIGDISISIKNASNMFQFLKDIEYGYENDNEYVNTISMCGINNVNYADYLNMAIYILWNIPENESKDINISKFIDEKINGEEYTDVYFGEVFYFYNEAMKIIDTEISILYFYKILEYFFLVIRKDEFKNIIKRYIRDENIDYAISELSKIYKQQELLQLKFLLEYIELDIQEIIDEAISKDIIRTCNISEFAEALYSFRNSIVHGKSSEKFDLKLPNRFINNEEEIFWKYTIKFISEVLINKLCIKTKKL